MEPPGRLSVKSVESRGAIGVRSKKRIENRWVIRRFSSRAGQGDVTRSQRSTRSPKENADTFVRKFATFSCPYAWESCCIPLSLTIMPIEILASDAPPLSSGCRVWQGLPEELSSATRLQEESPTQSKQTTGL
jgi:hypothetical protein